jgi:hypothetical protein
VQCIVNRFLINEKSNRDMDVEKNEKGTDNFVLELGSLLNVG